MMQEHLAFAFGMTAIQVRNKIVDPLVDREAPNDGEDLHLKTNIVKVRLTDAQVIEMFTRLVATADGEFPGLDLWSVQKAPKEVIDLTP